VQYIEAALFRVVEQRREVTQLQRKYTIVAGLLLLLAPYAISLGQGIGYSIWEKPPAETQPVISWYGQTGLIAVPSALVGPPMSVQAGAHWVNTNWTIGTQEEDLWAYAATVAVTGNLEVGVARLEHVPALVNGTERFDDNTIFNAKYNVDFGRWTRIPEAPEVAVGVWDIGNEVNRGYYVVATKSLHLREVEGPADVTFTIGFGNNELDKGALDGIFGGIELVPAPMVRLQAEYDAEDFNAALRIFVSKNLSLDAATIDGDLGVGATYRIGF
jgi:hypothetical protein